MNDGLITACNNFYRSNICVWNLEGINFQTDRLISGTHWLKIKFYETVAINSLYYTSAGYETGNGVTTSDFDVRIGNIDAQIRMTYAIVMDPISITCGSNAQQL
jgi:hypothetical protein